jgi:hypothetical protein
MKQIETAIQIVAANQGRLVGKTRLQKTAYLLQLSGMEPVYDFDYHHYGPFSTELAEGAEIAVATGDLQAEDRPGPYDLPYTIFTTEERPQEAINGLPIDRAREILRTLERVPSVVLELAATMAFLAVNGTSRDQIAARVRSLKPRKATPDRLEAAEDLLREIGLADMAPLATV